MDPSRKPSDDRIDLGPEVRADRKSSNVAEHHDEESKINALGFRRKRSIILDWWFELAALAVACWLLATIFGILAKYHDLRLEDWTKNYSISLNTVVAVLSTVLRTLIIMIAEEVISQLKWLWQLRRRPVAHLNHIDEASRGLFGSFMLFFRLRAFSVIYIGCLIMLFSLAVGPLSQQAAGTKTCVKPISGRAGLPYTFTGIPYFRANPGIFIAEPGVQARIANACADPANRNSTFLVQGCSTGNCSFPVAWEGQSLSTLGVCSRCIDTTKFISKVVNGGFEALVLPNNVSLSTGQGSSFGSVPPAIVSSFGDLDWARSDLDEYFLAALAAPVVNLTLIGTTLSGCHYSNATSSVDRCDRPPSLGFSFEGLQDKWQKVNVYSAACTLYPCMRHHKVGIEQGILTETLVAQTPTIQPDAALGYYYFLNATCRVASKTVDLTKGRIISPPRADGTFQVQIGGSGSKLLDIPWSSNCFVAVSAFSIMALREALKVVNGSCNYFYTAPPETLQARAERLQCTPWSLVGLINGGLATPSSTAATISAVADAITNRMRELAVQKNFLDTGPSTEPSPTSNETTGGYVYGDVLQTTVCTDFRWQWLLGPASLLLITAVFLAVTVTRSVRHRDREPLWKSSLLPALYASPGSELRGVGHGLEKLEKAAEGHYVTLVRVGEERWELIKEMDGVVEQEEREEKGVAVVEVPRNSTEPDEDGISA